MAVPLRFVRNGGGASAPHNPGLISWREKDVQVIDLDSVMKKCEVIAMEGEYVENAGAVFYHLIGR